MRSGGGGRPEQEVQARLPPMWPVRCRGKRLSSSHDGGTAIIFTADHES